MRRSYYRDQRNNDIRHNQYKLVAICIVTTAIFWWKKQSFPQFMFWFLCLIMIALTVYIIAELIKKIKTVKPPDVPIQLDSTGYENDNDAESHHAEPIIIDKDYDTIDIEAWADETVAVWKKESSYVYKGASQADIDNTQQQLGFIFPPAFHALYRKANGATDINDKFSLWSLQEILNANKGTYNGRFIYFADGWAYCWNIAFDKENGMIINMYTSAENVTDNFMYWIDMVLVDAPQLY